MVQLRKGTSARGTPTRPQTNHPTHSTCTAGLTALTQACCGNSQPHARHHPAIPEEVSKGSSMADGSP